MWGGSLGRLGKVGRARGAAPHLQGSGWFFFQRGNRSLTVAVQPDQNVVSALNGCRFVNGPVGLNRNPSAAIPPEHPNSGKSFK